MHSRFELGGEFANYRAIIKLQDAISYQLIILMPLARDYDHIAGTREAQGYRNRAAPIGFDQVSGRIIRARFIDASEPALWSGRLRRRR